MSKPTGYQFIRIQGFPRGPASKRHTVGSILAEGLRQPGHISHIPGTPRYELERLDSPLGSVTELPAWLNEQMELARNKSTRGDGTEYFRSVRKDALAIGTFIASLPEPMSEFNFERYRAFSKDTTDWFKDFLAPYEMLIHFRLNHFDEEHPHFHLWFTPEPNDVRESNWSLNSVCSQRKQFYHELQKRFFSEVGHQYFKERAKPFDERKPRTSRWQAVKQREAGAYHHHPHASIAPASTSLSANILNDKAVRSEIERLVVVEAERRERKTQEELHSLLLAITCHINKAQILNQESWLRLILNEAYGDDRGDNLYQEFIHKMDAPVSKTGSKTTGSTSSKGPIISGRETGEGWTNIIGR